MAVVEECLINMALFFTIYSLPEICLCFHFPDGSVCFHKVSNMYLLHTRSGLLGAIRTQQNSSVISAENIRCMYTKATMKDNKMQIFKLKVEERKLELVFTGQ